MGGGGASAPKRNSALQALELAKFLVLVNMRENTVTLLHLSLEPHHPVRDRTHVLRHCPEA